MGASIAAATGGAVGRAAGRTAVGGGRPRRDGSAAALEGAGAVGTAAGAGAGAAVAAGAGWGLPANTPDTAPWATTRPPPPPNARIIQWGRRPSTLNFGSTTFSLICARSS